MSDLPRPARIYLTALTACALGVLALVLLTLAAPSLADTARALCFGILIALAWLFPLPVAYKTKLYLDTAVLTALVLLVEPGPALAAAGLGAGLAHLLRRQSWD